MSGGRGWRNPATARPPHVEGDLEQRVRGAEKQGERKETFRPPAPPPPDPLPAAGLARLRGGGRVPARVAHVSLRDSAIRIGESTVRIIEFTRRISEFTIRISELTIRIGESTLRIRATHDR